jgi:hypothetical protein
MTGSDGVLSIPSEHLPGFVALVVLPSVIWLALGAVRALAARNHQWAVRLVGHFDRLGFTAKAVLFASLVGAAVHAAIVPTHWGPERVTAVLFIADTIGFLGIFWMTLTGRRYWRAAAAAMLGGTAVAYVFYVVRGWETMDLVGLITTTIEFATALLVLSPQASLAGARRRERWLALGALPLALATLLGTAAAAGVTASSAAVPAATTRTASSKSMPSMSPRDTTTALSLATNSPAGPIVWPDNMANMGPGMQMVTPNCTAQPSVAQQRAAVKLVNETVAAVAPYKSLAAAKAAGYIPITPSGQLVVHYINPAYYRDGAALDPSKVPSLVYVNTSHGAVLLAAMYLIPASDGANPPQPGGCLTQWHIHTDLCFSAGHVVGNDNSGACAAGSVNTTTAPMMHIWVTPVSGGPLTPDPPASTELQAANQMPLLAQPNGTA